jgi:predicted Zn-dependent protease with MMP-like domain
MDKILSINLETSTAPIVQEVRGRDYIEYGTEDWRNLYPQFLIDLYYNSSTHAAIINATAEMIAGEDLVCEEDDTNLESYVKLKKFLRHANSNESLHQVIKKVAFDFKLQGAYALHIVWNRERTEIAELYHVPVERVRAGRPNAMGKVDCYYISADWGNTRTNKPYPINAFNVNDRTSGSQLLYTGAYSPNMDCYHTPDYLAANNWCLVDQKVAEFHLNNIENGFSGSYFVSFANGIPTQEERRQIEQSLVEKFTGASNSGKFILTFSDDKTRTPEITPISVSDADKQYLALQELLVQNILTGHRVTSPMLMGIKSDTGLGSNVDELNAAGNFYLNTVVKPFQLHILNTLQTIFSVNNMDLPVQFVQLKPITVEFTSEDLKGVMTEDEIREEVGLKPLADVEVREDFNTELSTEKTELDKFIEEFGEDIPEEWELIEEEVVDGEHQDFNYEEVLNELMNEKLELASTGRAIPSRKSEQDGISKKSYDYFRVRYVYANDNFLENKSGSKRDFCKKMEAAKKLYRKEDIINMGKIPVNAGFGIDGAPTYSIWLYKGGPQCHHFWSRRIYKTVIGESKTTKIEDADMIGYTKARSEGFTAKKNDKLVATPPKKMKNNGYYN